MPSIKSKPVSRPWLIVKCAKKLRDADDNFDYNATKWRKDRAAHLAENPLCVLCKKAGILSDATVSDHIKPVRQGGDLWDWSNRQGLCETCHNQKRGRESHSKRNRRVGGY